MLQLNPAFSGFQHHPHHFPVRFDPNQHFQLTYANSVVTQMNASSRTVNPAGQNSPQHGHNTIRYSPN